MTKVGRSSRTPFKHWLLDKELGRITGILANNPSRCPATASPFHIIDLCAGDGVVTETHDASPAIILKHAKHAWTRNTPCRVTLIERNEHTCASLWQHILLETVQQGCVEVLNQDAREYEIPITGPSQAIFINCDPNHMADFPMTEQGIAMLPPMTTLLVTMGCNVGGLKRLSLEERRRWFEWVGLIKATLPRWHDLLLVIIVRDNHQWGYLLRLPAPWITETRARIEKQGDRDFPHGVTTVPYRSDRHGFDDLIDALFLTSEELRVRKNPPLFSPDFFQ